MRMRGSDSALSELMQPSVLPSSTMKNDVEFVMRLLEHAAHRRQQVATCVVDADDDRDEFGLHARSLSARTRRSPRTRAGRTGDRPLCFRINASWPIVQRRMATHLRKLRRQPLERPPIRAGKATTSSTDSLSRAPTNAADRYNSA